ncbi:transketolase [Rheinheimera texasensis]|uniref:transketolase n=1 Tax=Rheinheimera texasensis TaxID=306205 RepID=UPI0004E20973|nr:transketolase [Rheinheimera texasensis]
MTATTEQQLANAIRVLAMDAVQQAKSGHPGAPMGMADIATVLWRDFFKHNPQDPAWVDRDRFVLSNGHGSMLLYALLHLSGYDLPMSELQRFRQLHSKTPGHPEYGYTLGVETTTGPLGAGIANAVGMAVAEKTLAAQFNQPGLALVDHFTYCFLGDGCLMEGVSHEACSLAGTLQLGKLIAFWDDNGISIDGHVEGWFSDNTPQRFAAYGWQVISGVDGHDPAAIAQAIREAQANTHQPTLICCKTVIGFGSPNKAGTHDCHGAPLGETEVAAVRAQLGWPWPAFEIPPEIAKAWDQRDQGTTKQLAWQQLWLEYQSRFPALAAEFNRRVLESDLPASFAEVAQKHILDCQQQAQAIATRKASQQSIGVFAALLPEILGGSADLAGSNLTLWPEAKALHQHADGNYLHYGVREFGMNSIMNGVALHGGFIPFGGTFLMFMEYGRNAVRMAALMGIRSIFVYTHDSIAQGEDGPTHQPVEQVPNLRLTPNLSTWRPADATETAVAWQHALKRKQGPTALVLSRQNTAAVVPKDLDLSLIQRGAYVVAQSGQQAVPALILLATGAEVGLAFEAYQQLAASGVAVRLVSMPSTDVFDAQDAAYQAAVLPAGSKILAIEAAHQDYWYKYTGRDGAIIGMRSFGESAPGPVLMQHFGFSVENIVAVAQQLLA